MFKGIPFENGDIRSEWKRTKVYGRSLGFLFIITKKGVNNFNVWIISTCYTFKTASTNFKIREPVTCLGNGTVL